MTSRLIIVSAVIAATAYQTAQAVARTDVSGRRVAGHVMADCVRAPAVGAFASAPYTQPPCLPNKSN